MHLFITLFYFMDLHKSSLQDGSWTNSEQNATIYACCDSFKVYTKIHMAQLCKLRMPTRMHVILPVDSGLT